MKLPPAEISCPRWPQLQKGQREDRVPAALQSSVFQPKQLISVGPMSVGMVYTVWWSGQPFTAWEPFPYPSGSYVPLHNSTG